MQDFDVSFRVAGALFDAFTKSERAKTPAVAPFTITVSRESGARGKLMAEEIGRLLGWPVYDREIMEKIAEKLGRPSSHVEGVDERPIGWLEECLTGILAAHRILPGTYLKHSVGVIRGLGLLGHCVIVGRGANFILPSASTLRVRLVAPLSDRIKVVAARHGLSEDQAAKHVARTDRHRQDFVRDNLHKDAGAADQYDLVLNSSRLSVAECAHTTIDVLRILEAKAAGPKAPAASLVGAAR
jgi:hypothetical protein